MPGGMLAYIRKSVGLASATWNPPHLNIQKGKAFEMSTKQHTTTTSTFRRQLLAAVLMDLNHPKSKDRELRDGVYRLLVGDGKCVKCNKVFHVDDLTGLGEQSFICDGCIRIGARRKKRAA